MGENNPQYKQITQELYKKNLELVNTNQALALLQRLYEIIVSSQDVQKISQAFIDLIVAELRFVSGSVFLINRAKNTLQLTAYANSPINKQIMATIGKPASEINVPLKGIKNFLVEAVLSKQKMVTNNIFDIWDAWLLQEKRATVEALVKSENIQTIFVQPILLGQEVFGVFTASAAMAEAEITPFEKDLLLRLTNVFGVGIDRALLYVDLQVANEKLKELDERKDEFLNIAAHELRAPMTAIKGYLSMILEGDAGAVTPGIKEYLDIALSSNDRLIRLVNNMLNASRIEENRQVYQMGIVNLIEVIKTNYNEFLVSAKEKGLDLTLNVATPAPGDSVYVDRDRIYEVVANLISNAIKYTDQGSVAINVLSPKQGVIRMEVKDTGQGIAPADQARMFQKYYRVEEAAERKIGTGLGLYISKLLVEKFGGTIGFTSEIGKGSTFWFELPITSPTSDKPGILV